MLRRTLRILKFSLTILIRIIRILKFSLETLFATSLILKFTCQLLNISLLLVKYSLNKIHRGLLINNSMFFLHIAHCTLYIARYSQCLFINYPSEILNHLSKQRNIIKEHNKHDLIGFIIISFRT